VVGRRAQRLGPAAFSRAAGRIASRLDGGLAAGTLVQGEANRAAVWSGLKDRVLGNPADVESDADAINAAATVVGFFVPEGGARQDSLTPGSRRAAMWKRGRQTALPDLGGP